MIKNQDVNDHDLANTKKHLYWAVLEEKDFEEQQPHAGTGEDLGRTQAYVWVSAAGIKVRWAGNRNTSHCKKMEQIEAISNSYIYDNIRCF